MRLEMITNGLVVEEQAAAIAGAGFFAVTFSVDGPAAIHDDLRGVPDGLERLLRGARELKARGVRIGACTQINRHNLGALDAVHAMLLAERFDGWQLQLTMPIGMAAARRDELCVAPSDLPEIERKILAYEAEGSMFCHPSDNIGYMSRNEPKLRSGTGREDKVWLGCRAGIDVIGVTSDGTVRGCLSLPTAFDEGNVRDRPLAGIWRDPGAFAWNRRRSAEQLTGKCAACPFAKVCRAGCSCLAFSATGGNAENPYCLFALDSAPAGAAIR
jgi:radical SAM protein with 4Fe4S-binding SPASM domain